MIFTKISYLRLHNVTRLFLIELVVPIGTFKNNQRDVGDGSVISSPKKRDFLALELSVFSDKLNDGGDTCSWKGQLERTRSWKVLSWKVWSWKVWPKLERTERSWKEPSEVGKNWAKLERTQRSWKEPSEVGKFFFKLESFAQVGKFRCSWKVLAEVGKYEWTWKVVTEVRKLWLKLCQKWFLHFIY